ncbi:MAG: hypothetical protein JNL53_02660 [Cyclobacteriaceae bacterium]|nr:hypothetical protein [Cyclobacteriaceae bacterium]
MKKGRILLLVGFFAITTLVNAQDYTFRVLANKGANEIKSGDSWQPVKTGASLKLGDELKVTENASIGLVHSSGKPLEVKKASTYKVADLAAQVGGSTSVLNKYTDFILSSNSAEAKKNRLSATGAVHRGLGIKVYLPNNQYASVFNNIVYVNWDKSEKGPYVVSFLNMFDDVLQKIETPENVVSIDLNDPKFAGETAILVEIQSKTTNTKSDERYLIKKLSTGEQAKINVAYTDVMKELKEESALNKLVLAGFFEQNKLLIDAITAYEQAMKLAPDDPTYSDYYEEFLLRNKLKAVK